VSKGNELGRSGRANGKVGLGNWACFRQVRGDVEVPQTVEGSAFLSELTVLADSDSGSSEGHSATGTAKSSNGNKGLSIEGWHNMCLASSEKEAGWVQVGSASGAAHHFAVEIVSSDGRCGEALVMNWHFGGAKMSGVGNGDGGI
jgi:hypothetical protein